MVRKGRSGGKAPRGSRGGSGKSSGKKPQATLSAKFIVGRLVVAAAGCGFVTPEDGGAEIFIPPKYLGDALDGDVVRVKPLPPREPGRDKGLAASVDKVLERRRTTIVGELIAGRKVRPLNRRLPEDIAVEGSVGEAKRGDWVELELTPGTPKQGWAPRGRVAQRIGRGGTIAADLDAVIREYGLSAPYSAKEDAAALALQPMECVREDLTSLSPVSIDPVDAKDYDDAISLSPGEGKAEVVLGVHIADVAAWVAPDAALDAAAATRGFTAYLPGRTLPMLPPGLTRRISLSPEGESLSHTVLITIERATGRVLRARRCRARIRLAARLSFDEVQQAIDGKPPQHWSAPLAKMIGALTALTRTMRAWRQREEDFLELATEEIRVIMEDGSESVRAIQRRAQREADQLVEECMLAANVEVARELIARHIPGLFRVHPEPDPEKLLELSVFLEQTFDMTPGDLSSRSACNAFLRGLPEDQRKPVIVDAFLRALPRAHYLAKNALHFGLGKGVYSHFTSPIRRYPDLIVHQQLWAADQAGAARPVRRREQAECAALAEATSDRERVTDEAYYAATDRLKLHYLKQHIAHPEKGFYEAVIRKVSRAGLLVDIPDMGVVGFVPAASLSGSFSQHAGRLLAREGHRQYRVGDFIYLRLEQADLIRGRAVFRPVE
jgi:ribonuclease R